MRTCTQCGLQKELTEFAKDRRKLHGRRHQCKVCSAAAMKRFLAEYKQKHGVRYEDRYKTRKTCEVCAESFLTRHPEQVYCSRTCRAEGMHGPDRGLRVRKNIQKSTRLYIFERDRWHCQLCHKRVDRDLAWPDPWSATVDHLIPHSQGGSDELVNLQLAHATCNFRKQDRAMDEQLMLFG